MNPSDDRRAEAGRRTVGERRWIVDLHYTGQERREGRERRYASGRRSVRPVA